MSEPGEPRFRVGFVCLILDGILSMMRICRMLEKRGCRNGKHWNQAAAAIGAGAGAPPPSSAGVGAGAELKREVLVMEVVVVVVVLGTAFHTGLLAI
jgi:hypothetical protein